MLLDLQGAQTGSLQGSGFLPEYHAGTRRVSCQYHLSIKCRHQSESDHCKSGLFVDVSYEQSSCTNSVSQIRLQTLKDGYDYKLQRLCMLAAKSKFVHVDFGRVLEF